MSLNTTHSMASEPEALREFWRSVGLHLTRLAPSPNKHSIESLPKTSKATTFKKYTLESFIFRFVQMQSL